MAAIIAPAACASAGFQQNLGVAYFPPRRARVRLLATPMSPRCNINIAFSSMLIGIESRAWDDLFSLEGFLAGPTPPGPRPPTEELACGVFMRSHRGFSLIELLLVVAVILIIAAIAVPNFSSLASAPMRLPRLPPSA